MSRWLDVTSACIFSGVAALCEINIASKPVDETTINPTNNITACQVLTNLCQNGLRHARKARKQEAEVVLRILSESDSSASLEITDNGFGIADNQVSRLFEPFNTTEHDGTGLGLYLCRELCQANQATIEFIGNHPGARFLVTMKRT